jgi:ribosomal protein L27
MPRVRELAAELVAAGQLVCTQRGEPAHPLTTRGAIRLAAAARM